MTLTSEQLHELAGKLASLSLILTGTGTVQIADDERREAVRVSLIASHYLGKSVPQEVAERLRGDLSTVLDAVDYTSGACAPNEPVGGALPVQLIENARESLAAYSPFARQGEPT